MIVGSRKKRPVPARAGHAIVIITAATAVGQALVYGLTVYLANHLTPSVFSTYVTAVAAFLLAGKLASAGVDRLALRVLPTALAASDWSLMRGFLRFAARRAGSGVVLVCVLALAIAAWLRPSHEQVIGLLIGFLALPMGVAASIGGEMLTALGQPRRAALLLRLPVPLTAITVILGANAGGIPITGLLAVSAWTLGWVVAAGLIAATLAKSLPCEIWRATPRASAQEWRTTARPLWLYRGSTALMAQASLLALVWSGAAAADVTVYVAAASTVSVVLMLANSTNRLYARELAMVLDRQDAAGLVRLRAHRRAWLLPLVAIFLGAVFFVPGLVLGLFRADIGDAAASTLQILSVAAAVTLGLALVPTYLSYRGRARTVYQTMFMANVAQVVLLCLLLPNGGATGAALAYGVVSIFFYARLTMTAHQDALSFSAGEV